MPNTDIIDCRKGVPKNTDIALILTQEQAQVIRDIVGGGITGEGRRDLTTQLFLVMDDAGLKASHRHDFEGMLRFRKL